jgi:hypothetical protein
MLCRVCKKKPATVHLTEIKGNKVQKMDLCEACAKTKGVNDLNFALADLLPRPAAPQEIKQAAGVVELMKYPTTAAVAELIAAARNYRQSSGWLLKSQPGTN